MKINAIIVILLALFVASCSSEKESEVTPSVYDDIELELNDGKKWEVSNDMKVYMVKSINLVNHDKPDYDRLAISLVELKDEFVSHCDMQGHGHDVLHSWLMPYLDLLEDFENAENEADQKKALAQIKRAHEVFEEYFE